MAESVDVPIPPQMLEAMGLFKAANKELMQEIKNLRGDVKALQKDGKAIPQDLADRMARLDEHRVRVQAKQAAQDAVNESIAKVHKTFDKFSDNVSQVRSLITSPPASVGDLAHRGGAWLLDKALDSVGRNIAAGKADATAKGGQMAASGFNASMIPGAAKLGKDMADIVGKIGGSATMQGAAAAMGGFASTVGAVAKHPVVAAITWAEKQIIQDTIDGNNMRADANRTLSNLQESLFLTRQRSVYTNQRSPEEMVEQVRAMNDASARVATDWFNPKEVIARASDTWAGYIPTVWGLNKLFGSSGRGEKLKRQAEAQVAEVKFREFSRVMGTDYEKANNLDAMINDARRNPKSKLAQKFVSTHRIAGINYRGTHTATDEELRALGQEVREAEMATKEKHWRDEQRRITENPAWQASEHSRSLWVDEVGRHRYERTLNWNEI